MANEKNLVEEKVDNVTLEITSGTVQVKADSIGDTQMKDSGMLIADLNRKLGDGDVFSTGNSEIYDLPERTSVDASDECLIESGAITHEKKKMKIETVQDHDPKTHAGTHEAGTDPIDHNSLGIAADDHHAKYTDAEAVAAMGAKADSNPLNHDRPTTMPPTIISDSSATPYTTTSPTFVLAKRFTKTTEAKKYLIKMFCEIYQSDKDKMVWVEAEIDGTTHVFEDWEIPDQNEAREIPMAAYGEIVATLTAVSHNFDFNLRQQRGGTAKAKNFRLVIMEVNE